MRAFALGLIILSDIIIGLTHGVSINPGTFNFLLTMIVVVVAAFAVSAVLRNIQSITMTRNYTISGIIGIALGIGFFLWIQNNTAALISWFEEHGLTILLGLNILGALTIFFVSSKKKSSQEVAQ